MNTMFLEILSEEVPARLAAKAAADLYKKLLDAARIVFATDAIEGEYIYTLRRFACKLTNIPEATTPVNEEIRGPRINAPEQALQGFMRKYKIEGVSQLEQRGDFYFYVERTPGESAKDAVKRVVEEVVQAYVWPKSMKWGDNTVTWIRPIHSIICLLNTDVVPVEYGHIRADRVSRGHRFIAADEFEVTSWGGYIKQLGQHSVVATSAERRQMILTAVAAIEEEKAIELIKDDGLLAEVVDLVEYPNVYLGSIDQEFLELPEELLVTAIKVHQKYLMFRNPKTGKIAPYFLIVADCKPTDGGKVVIKGNERVLKARLHDAKFFFENDKKERLDSRLEGLKALLFHEDIGTVYDKVMSMKRLAQRLAQQLGVDAVLVERAVLLAKCDLLSETVGEFPELQGVMGYYYAKHDGESEAVAVAVREHYKPQGPSDSLPTEDVAAVVALADKLDTLQQLFAAGIKPTGSKDPYASRRNAIGIIRICADRGFKLDLIELGIGKDVREFIAERARMMLKEEGVEPSLQVQADSLISQAAQ
jgi:glycyl-tRNA synthetase beta chain